MMTGDEEIERLLKEVLPSADRELQRDLWPAMLRKLEATKATLSWFDWALIAALGSWILFYPEGILQLLYHL